MRKVILWVLGGLWVGLALAVGGAGFGGADLAGAFVGVLFGVGSGFVAVTLARRKGR